MKTKWSQIIPGGEKRERERGEKNEKNGKDS